MYRFRDVVMSTPPVLNAPLALHGLLAALVRKCRRVFGRGGGGRGDGKSPPPELQPVKSARRASMLFAASPKQPSTDEEEDAVAKPKNLYDGKLLVEAFLKQQDKLAPDTPHSLALQLASASTQSLSCRAS